MNGSKKRAFANFSVLALSLFLGISAFILTYLKLEIPITPNFWILSTVFVILTIIAHVLIRKFFPYSDPLIFPIVCVLNGIGLAEINRIDLAYITVGYDWSPALTNQLIWTVVGAILAGSTLFILKDHRKLRGFTYTAMAMGLLLVILPLIPGIGMEINGANVWVSLGPLGTFQPAEFAKVCFAVFFAGYLTINAERLKSAGRKIIGVQLPRLVDTAPILLVWLLSLAVLVLQHDLGTSLLFFGAFIAAVYVATGKLNWVVIGMILFALGAFASFKMFSHVGARVDVWLDPMNPEIYNRLYGGSGQVVQGFFALGNGGFFGTGLGGGYPRLTPFSNSDFIYTALGEELGLTGLMAILILYLLLVQRGFSAAIKSRDSFGGLLAAGLSFSLVLQVFVVIGGVTGLIPLTGLTLPFIARGGSSLVANWVMVALIILVSNGARKPSSAPSSAQNSTHLSSSVAPNGARKPQK